MTRGLESPETYYRRVYVDAVRAVQAVRTHPLVDATRVAVHGISQGGGIALAASALVPDVFATMPDVPFLCHFERGSHNGHEGGQAEQRRTQIDRLKLRSG